jgi:hypothetical protein
LLFLLSMAHEVKHAAVLKRIFELYAEALDALEIYLEIWKQGYFYHMYVALKLRRSCNLWAVD